MFPRHHLPLCTSLIEPNHPPPHTHSICSLTLLALTRTTTLCRRRCYFSCASVSFLVFFLRFKLHMQESSSLNLHIFPISACFSISPYSAQACCVFLSHIISVSVGSLNLLLVALSLNSESSSYMHFFVYMFVCKTSAVTSFCRISLHTNLDVHLAMCKQR